MTNRLRFDTNGQVENPTLVLGTVDGRKLGYLNAGTSFVYQQNFNSANEISFTVYKSNCSDELWENITDLLTVWYKEIDEWFQISVQVDDSDTTCKQITGTSICESELSQTNIFTTEINTEDDILRDDYTEPTVFYNPDNPDASLLNRMMDKVPQYKIAHVDSSIMNIQRTFSFDKITILDAFDEVAEEIGCLFLYDSSTDDDGHIARTVNAYDLQRYCKDCGYRFEEDGDCPRCGSSNIQEPYGDDSGIIISKDNLSDEAIYKTDIDSVKNCFKLSAGDDLMTATIRSCNANGSDYLWIFPSYLRKYMTDELVSKLEEYESIYTEYENAHNFTINSTDYNDLVTKYRDRNENLVYIYSGATTSVSEPCVKLTNFPQVIAAWYYVIDFEGYLKTTMMPTVDISSTNAEAQVEDIYNQLNGRSVSVTDLKDYTSAELIETCVKSLAKLYAYTSKYTVTVTTNTWNNPTWTGTVTITNNNDEDDTATTSLITMTATAGIEAYTEQLIQVKLNKANTDDYSVTDLFNSYDDDRDEFIRRLTLYSYDCLASFSDCCQTCIGILDEQYEAFSTETYQTLIDFRNGWIDRGALINEEMSVRDSEIIKLVGNGATEPDKVVYGIYDDIQAIVDEVHSILDVENFLGEDLWYELLNYRREDTYNNTNYISDGLTNAELIENAELFLDAASKELYKSAMLQHSITSTLKNLLVMPEFERIVDNFQVGSWIRFIVDETPYKLRLLSYEIQFDNTQNIDVEFSDVKDIWNGASDIESILKSAVGMGSSYSSVTRQAEKGSDAEGVVSGWTQQGLPATLELVSNADNQEMIFDEHGLLLRRYNDITETYLNDQIKLINSTIAFTDDAWATIHTAIGRIYAPNGEQVFGINTKYLIGEIILGEQVYIESVSSDGDTIFKVDGDGIYMNVAGNDGESVFKVDSNGVVINAKDENGNTAFILDPSGIAINIADSNGDTIFKADSSGISINMGQTTTEDGETLSGYIQATAKGIETEFDGKLGDYVTTSEFELTSNTFSLNFSSLGTTQILRGTEDFCGTETTDGSLTTSLSASWGTGQWRTFNTSNYDNTVTAIYVENLPNANITTGVECYSAESSGANYAQILQYGVPISIGSTYTLSCYARGNGSLRFRYGEYVSSGTSTYDTKSFEVTDDWVRYEFTFTIEEQYTHTDDDTIETDILIGGGSSGTIEICGMKLENGYVATAWASSPQDTTASIQAGIAEVEGNVVSYINASADIINLESNRLTVSSDNFNLTADGVITATSGTIGGWTIDKDALYRNVTSTSDYVQLGSPSNDNTAIMAGSNSASSAPFRVATDGTVNMTKACVYGIMSVYDSATLSSAKEFGSVGYMSGEDGQGNTTDGIAMWETSNKNYFIATTAGVRMQAGQHSIYIIDEGGITFNGDTTSFNSAIYARNHIDANAYIQLGNGVHLYGLNNPEYDSNTDESVQVILTYMGNRNTVHFGDDSYPTRIHGSSIVSSVAITVNTSTSSRDGFEELTEDYSTVFDSLTPIVYTSTEDEKMHLGLTAENVDDALDNAGFDSDEFGLTTYSADENTGAEDSALAYDEIIALLVHEVQNLKEEIKNLKEEKE